MKPIYIAEQFNGPANSGNGGYCCGLFAATLEAGAGEAIEVALRSPPPLNTGMDHRQGRGGIEITAGETLVALVNKTRLDLDPPPCPTMQQAMTATRSYSGFDQHPFPHCFVCGTERAPGDGLRIFPGPLADHSQVCAPWQPFAQLADEHGMVRSEFIWAALDCPSYFGTFIGQPNTPALLGTMVLQILSSDIPVDQPYIISAWPERQEGRKWYGGSALFTPAGRCLALSHGTWIALQ